MLFSRIREERKEADLRTKALGRGELVQECCTWWREGAESTGGKWRAAPTFPNDLRLAHSFQVCRACLSPAPLARGGGWAVLAKIGLPGAGGMGGVRGRGGQAPQAGSQGSGGSWLINLIGACHTPPPLTPTNCSSPLPSRRERLEIDSPGFHSCLQLFDH